MPKTPFEIDLPPDLTKALHTRPTLAVIFKSLSVDEQNKYVDWIVHAKTIETTRERISATIKELEAKAT